MDESLYHYSLAITMTLMTFFGLHMLLARVPERKILEISELSGFLSLSHYSKKFAEKEGCTPARWREEHASK